MDIKTTTVKTETVTLELTGELLEQMIRRAFPQHVGSNSKIKIQFEVPRGGDYSGTTLDLDDEQVLKVSITNVE